MGYRPALWRIPGLLRPGFASDHREYRGNPQNRRLAGAERELRLSKCLAYLALAREECYPAANSRP